MTAWQPKFKKIKVIIYLLSSCQVSRVGVVRICNFRQGTQYKGCNGGESMVTCANLASLDIESYLPISRVKKTVTFRLGHDFKMKGMQYDKTKKIKKLSVLLNYLIT